MFRMLGVFEIAEVHEGCEVNTSSVVLHYMR